MIVSTFANDFGDAHEVPAKGLGDWEEGKYWLDKIVEFTAQSTRGLPHVIVPVPDPLMFSRRRSGFYPGKIANILDDSGLMFLNPTDSFINAHLGEVRRRRAGRLALLRGCSAVQRGHRRRPLLGGRVGGVGENLRSDDGSSC